MHSTHEIPNLSCGRALIEKVSLWPKQKTFDQQKLYITSLKWLPLYTSWYDHVRFYGMIFCAGFNSVCWTSLSKKLNTRFGVNLFFLNRSQNKILQQNFLVFKLKTEGTIHWFIKVSIFKPSASVPPFLLVPPFLSSPPVVINASGAAPETRNSSEN